MLIICHWSVSEPSVSVTRLLTTAPAWPARSSHIYIFSSLKISPTLIVQYSVLRLAFFSCSLRLSFWSLQCFNHTKPFTTLTHPSLISSSRIYGSTWKSTLTLVPNGAREHHHADWFHLKLALSKATGAFATMLLFPLLRSLHHYRGSPRTDVARL